MKTLIVYFSRSGRTRKAAERLAVLLQADLEELKEREAVRSGVLGFVKSGRDALAKKPADLLPLAHDPAAYDLVVLGSPVWAFTLCPVMRTFLAGAGRTIKKAAFLSTHGGGGPARSFTEAESLLGRPLAATVAVQDTVIDRDEAQSALEDFARRLM